MRLIDNGKNRKSIVSFLLRLVSITFFFKCKEIYFCFKVYFKIYFDGFKYNFNVVHFWRYVLTWIKEQITLNKSIANQRLLDYSKPTLDVALYYRKYKIKDIGSWIIFLLIIFIIWQTGFISIFFINFLYYFNQSNHLLLTFFKFDIFWYPIFLYKFFITFVVNKSYFVINNIFVLLI